MAASFEDPIARVHSPNRVLRRTNARTAADTSASARGAGRNPNSFSPPKPSWIASGMKGTFAALVRTRATP